MPQPLLDRWPPFRETLERARRETRARVPGEASAVLYRRIRRAALGVALRTLPREADLDPLELAQEVGARVLASDRLEGLEADGWEGFDAWIRRIAENTVRSALRRQGAQKRGAGRRPRRLSTATLLPHVSTRLWPSRRAVRAEELAILRRLVDALTEEERHLLHLRFHQDLTWEEIALLVRLPGAEAARKRTERLLQRLARGGRKLGLHIDAE